METAQLSDGTFVMIEPVNERFPTLERRAFNYSRHVACEHGSWEYCTLAALDDAPSFIRWYSAVNGPNDC